MQSDLAVGIALLPVGVAALREVRHVREVPFAALPLLFAAHQLIEAAVWAAAEGSLSASAGRAAAVAYLVTALPLLPLLFPVAVLLLEPRGARARVAPFAVLGATVAAYLTYALATSPVTVVVHEHALEYDTGVRNGSVWAVLYREAFVSLWCVWAACSSLLVLLHMVRRRRLPDPHRLQGAPLVPQRI